MKQLKRTRDMAVVESVNDGIVLLTVWNKGLPSHTARWHMKEFAHTVQPGDRLMITKTIETLDTNIVRRIKRKRNK